MTDAAIFDSFARASAVTGDLIDRIAADQWTAPTPCTQWSVLDVVDHLVGMNLVFVALFEKSPMPERGADRLGADPAAAYRRSAAALQAAAARPGVLERSQATSVGVATGVERLQWRIVDLLVHGWDLVQATGVVAELPDDLIEQALTFAQAQLPSQPRWTIRRSAAGPRQRTRYRPAGGIHRSASSVDTMNADIRRPRPPGAALRLSWRVTTNASLAERPGCPHAVDALATKRSISLGGGCRGDPLAVLDDRRAGQHPAVHLGELRGDVGGHVGGVPDQGEQAARAQRLGGTTPRTRMGLSPSMSSGTSSVDEVPAHV